MIVDETQWLRQLQAILYHFAKRTEEFKTSSTDTSDDTDVELAFPISVQ